MAWWVARAGTASLSLLTLGLVTLGSLGACRSDKGNVTDGGQGGAAGNKITTGTGGAPGPGSAGSTGAAGAGGSAGQGAGGSSGSTGTAPSGDSVLTHHKNPSRDGVYLQPTFTKAAITASFDKDPNFIATIGAGEGIYAQPLFVDNAAARAAAVAGIATQDLVIVATEEDNVYAVDAISGSQVWKTNLGVPVPMADLLCGNIDPYGITGTPVIDLASRTLFLDAVTTPDGGTTVKHLIFALSIDDGSIRPGWPVDVGVKASSSGVAFNDAPQGQRGALAVVNGTVYVPYGGLYGDCGQYRGWLLAVSIADPTQVQAWPTMQGQTGIWGPGGVASDGTDVYVTTGNSSTGTVWSGQEGLMRFSPGPSFAIPAYWAALNWMTLDAGDLDLGGTGPVVFSLPGSTPSDLALALGKDGNAYLLDRASLGGISAPLAMQSVSSISIIGSAAVYTTTTGTYAAFGGTGKICTQGAGALTTVKIVSGSPPTIAASWCADSGGGSPTVTTSDGHADSILWVLGLGNGHLEAFDGDTGAPIAFPGSTVDLPSVHRYSLPIVAKGRLYVAGDGTIVAFKGR